MGKTLDLIKSSQRCMGSIDASLQPPSRGCPRLVVSVTTIDSPIYSISGLPTCQMTNINACYLQTVPTFVKINNHGESCDSLLTNL